MIIVGGIYREKVSYPGKNDLFGSGLKAACAISGHAENLVLHSLISEEDRREVECIVNTFHIEPHFSVRKKTIEFHYFTPIAPPSVSKHDEKYNLAVTEKNVLVFGMLEANVKVEAQKLVYDPQSPTDTSIDLNNIKAEELILVLNKKESFELVREKKPELAGRIILEKFKAKAVVIKCGALGALVTEMTGSHWVSVCPSTSVWPVGSGDVFSAFFAMTWMEKGLSVIESAETASKAVSSWTQNPEVLPVILDKNHEHNKLLEYRSSPQVYLAGPFFNISQTWLIGMVKGALEDLGANVFSPLHEVGRGGDEVAIPDIHGIDGANSMLAILDGLDEGTIFEIGYARAKGIPVVAYCENSNLDELTMIRGTGIPIFTDLSTAVYQAIWAGM